MADITTYKLDAAFAPLEKFDHCSKPDAVIEVAELVAWLRRSTGCADESPMDLRAADLLERLAPQQVPVAERPWEREGWCDGSGRCWFGWAAEAGLPPDASWTYCRPSERDTTTVSLPAQALPLPASGEGEA